MTRKVVSTVIAALIMLGLSATTHAAFCEACPSVLHCEAELEGTIYDWKWSSGRGYYAAFPPNGLAYRKVNCTDSGSVSGYVNVFGVLWIADPWESYCPGTTS
jgi:hypothetical protein